MSSPSNQIEVSAGTQSGQQKSSVEVLFSDALKSDGTLDLRSTYGRSLRAAKEMLAADHIQAADSIVVDQIATLLTLQKGIERTFLSNPSQVICSDGLNSLIKKDLFQVIELTRKSLRFLADLRRSKKGTSADIDGIFDID